MAINIAIANHKVPNPYHQEGWGRANVIIAKTLVDHNGVL